MSITYKACQRWSYVIQKQQKKKALHCVFQQTELWTMDSMDLAEWSHTIERWYHSQVHYQSVCEVSQVRFNNQEILVSEEDGSELNNDSWDARVPLPKS